LNRLVGILLVALSAAAFGTLAIFGHYAYAGGLNVFTILFLRFTLAAGLMLAVLAARRQALPRGSLLLRLVGMGALGYVGQSSAYLTALHYASAGLVALLLYLYPVFVAGLAVVLLREPFTRSKALALTLALAGTALTAGPASGQALGILLAVSAALIYSIYIIVGTGVLRHVSPLQSSAVIFAAAGLGSGLLMLASGGPQWPTGAQGWAAMAGIVIVATVLPVVTFLAGLRRIGPTSAAMLSTLEPVVTVLLAAWLLKETLPAAALLGGGLILAAVLVLARSELRPQPRPALANGELA
jgi:drug/metabolite transporter (DMT)-like permease